MLHWHGKIETSQQADPVEKSSNYFSKWYVKNKPRLAAKRRTLYETNKSYREKAIARASAFRAAKREVPPAGYVVTLGMAANECPARHLFRIRSNGKAPFLSRGSSAQAKKP